MVAWAGNNRSAQHPNGQRWLRPAFNVKPFGGRGLPKQNEEKQNRLQPNH